jgi:hypothetical protein
MKNIFWGTLTFFLMLMCCESIYLINNAYKKEQLLLQENQDKKNRLDRYYRSQFYIKYSMMNETENSNYKSLCQEDIDKTENDMLADGYDHAQIHKIRTNGLQEAYNNLIDDSDLSE